ncbi:MAG: metal ABC transporter substrate-binding protein [Magnetococcales bacterium]|nr:metal ABC transporter substrate-binding protein [Magnetococcales bacterium]
MAQPSVQRLKGWATALGLAWVAALPLPAWAGSPLQVTASFSILADLTRQVGGDEVTVHTLVGPDGDAHVYQPTPAAARQLLASGMFVINGLGFEGWIPRLVKASGFQGILVVASQGIDPLRKGNDHDEANENHSPRQDHDHGGGADPHAWHDLANGRIYLANIAAGLIRLAPERAEIFRANLQRADQELADLDRWVRSELESLPPARRKVITTHDAFGYLARAYGLVFLAPVGISSDAEPSARDLARLALQAKKEGIRAIFLENMTNPRLMQQLAREAGAKIGGTLHADALSPPDGPAPSYAQMIRRNITLLKQAMSGE